MSDIAFDPENPCPRGSDPGTNANIAIMEALGINPRRVSKNATITLGPLGPVLEITVPLLDHHGHMYAKGDELATELRDYRLVPVEQQQENTQP